MLPSKARGRCRRSWENVCRVSLAQQGPKEGIKRGGTSEQSDRDSERDWLGHLAVAMSVAHMRTAMDPNHNVFMVFPSIVDNGPLAETKDVVSCPNV